jgi:hypothetical protein
MARFPQRWPFGHPSTSELDQGGWGHAPAKATDQSYAKALELLKTGKPAEAGPLLLRGLNKFPDRRRADLAGRGLGSGTRRQAASGLCLLLAKQTFALVAIKSAFDPKRTRADTKRAQKTRGGLPRSSSRFWYLSEEGIYRQPRRVSPFYTRTTCNAIFQGIHFGYWHAGPRR